MPPNHGGRQLDGVASSISTLPEVVAEVGERVEVYMDGGERGVKNMLGVFQREIALAMALIGVNRIGDLTPDLVKWKRF